MIRPRQALPSVPMTYVRSLLFAFLACMPMTAIYASTVGARVHAAILCKRCKSTE